jgi:hypothetical protein
MNLIFHYLFQNLSHYLMKYIFQKIMILNNQVNLKNKVLG